MNHSSHIDRHCQGCTSRTKIQDTLYQTDLNILCFNVLTLLYCGQIKRNPLFILFIKVNSNFPRKIFQEVTGRSHIQFYIYIYIDLEKLHSLNQTKLTIVSKARKFNKHSNCSVKISLPSCTRKLVSYCEN